MNNLKSRFISIASHEFRTPLSTILSSTGLIDQYLSLNQSENMPKHINRIKTSVKHLIDILNDFLSLDKLEQGKVDVEREEFDLQKFTAEIMSEFESILKPQQNIRFEYDGNTTVFLDKKIVHGILTNLLSNAVKYSEKDIELRVEVKQQQIKIMITDKGIGIPEEDQQHMFNKYFRATNVGNIKGTGLGLSIVQRYVELLKGTIDFSSTKSVGTTFRIQFPRTVMQNDTLFLFPLNA